MNDQTSSVLANADLSTLSLDQLGQHVTDLSRRTLTQAWELGRALNEAKKRVQHGGWKPWLKQHCHGVSYPTLVRYMRLADHNKTAEALKEKTFEASYLDSGITDLNKKRKERETAVKNINLTLNKLKELVKKYKELRPLVAELTEDVKVLSPAVKPKKKLKTVTPKV